MATMNRQGAQSNRLDALLLTWPSNGNEFSARPARPAL